MPETSGKGWRRSQGVSYIIVQVKEQDCLKSGRKSHPIKVTLQGDHRIVPPVQFTCNAVSYKDNYKEETVVKEVDVELFEVGIGEMGGEGFEEIVMGGPTTKEAKVKGAFLKHQRVDASKKKIKVIDEKKVVTSSGCLSSLDIY